jgi:hypothetical protein
VEKEILFLFSQHSQKTHPLDLLITQTIRKIFLKSKTVTLGFLRGNGTPASTKHKVASKIPPTSYPPAR